MIVANVEMVTVVFAPILTSKVEKWDFFFILHETAHKQAFTTLIIQHCR